MDTAASAGSRAPASRRGNQQEPVIASGEMDAAFAAHARSMGLDPSNRWIGGYVDYEWQHLRHVVEALPLPVAGLKVLEFGCNVGASAIVFSCLGAQVSAFDISEPMLRLAALNAMRYGRSDICFSHAENSRALPYSNSQFDLVVCNSVLEYVPPEETAAVMAELDRVLAPGGLMLVTGTSNRLWPRDSHSGGWPVNYLPRAVHRLLGRPVARGLSPWLARNGFGLHYYDLDNADPSGFFSRSRTAMGMHPLRLKTVCAIARLLRVSPGYLTPNLSCLLKKHT